MNDSTTTRESGQVPKVELHCHLDGVVTADMLAAWPEPCPVPRTLLDRIGPVQDMAGFQRWFDVVSPSFVGKLERFHTIVTEHARRLANDRVIYAELMVSKSEMPKDRGELIEAFNRLRSVADSVQPLGVHLEFLIALGRNKPPILVAEQAERALLLHERGLICGVALAGPEQFPVRPFADTFDRLRERGVAIEIHAGEQEGEDSVWDALTHGHPRRLGHGLAVFDDPRLVEHVIAHGIHIEFCPTSNRALTGRGDFVFRAIERALEHGISFSINTDDPSPLGCSMGSEYALVERELGLGFADLARITENALKAAFGRFDRLPGSAGGSHIPEGQTLT